MFTVASSAGQPYASSSARSASRGGELLEDRALHVDPLGAEAHLTAVGEAGPHRAGHRRVQVGVGEDQPGVLAAQLEATPPSPRRRRPA